MGDFNVPLFVNNDFGDGRTQIINNFMCLLNLRQANAELNSNDRLLDLILTNIDTVITQRNECPLVSEDMYHPALDISCSVGVEHVTPLAPNRARQIHNFRSANYVGLYDALQNTNWSFLYTIKNINHACNAFYRKIYRFFDIFVPLKSNYCSPFPVWFSKSHIYNIKLKNKYHTRYTRFKHPNDLHRFRELRLIVKRDSHRLYHNYIDKVQHQVKEDQRPTYVVCSI